MRRWMVDILLSNTFVHTYNGAKKSQFIKEKPILRSTLMQITRILKKIQSTHSRGKVASMICTKIYDISIVGMALTVNIIKLQFVQRADQFFVSFLFCYTLRRLMYWLL